MLGFYGSPGVARLNIGLATIEGILGGRASEAGGYCAEALAAKAANKNKYTGSGCVFGCDVDKQIEKWCEDKGATAAERCLEAKEAKDANKNTYRSENVDVQIAKWCAADAQVTAAKAGVYTPASPQQIAEELYWDESQMMTADSAFDTPAGEDEEKSSLLLPLAMGGAAILLLGGVLLASR